MMVEHSLRTLKLFHMLAAAQGFIKANELGAGLQISERTVKTEMEKLKGLALEKGCRVASVRGKGYRLEITDRERFEAYRQRLEILFNNVEKRREGRQTYSIARAIMLGKGANEKGYFRSEDLADELLLSHSALKKEMGGVREFLASFNLSLISTPGRGLRLAGKEFNIRLCMLELYENHYRTRVLPFYNKAYEKTLEDRGDKDEIRRVTLNLIRRSDTEIFDIFINRLVDYLLLARNRGKSLEFEPEQEDGFEEELSDAPEYRLAGELADALELFEGYCLDGRERKALGRLLLLWSDWEWGKEGLENRFPKICKRAALLAGQIREELSGVWRLPLDRLSWDLEEELKPEFVRILIQAHFGFCGCQTIGSAVMENAIKASPVSMILANCAARIVERSLGARLNAYNVQLLAVRFFALVDRIPYCYRPRRVLVCARNGRAGGEAIAAAVRRGLGDWWIGRLDVSALYEARKFKREEYDCVVGSYSSYAYNYTWPYMKVSQTVTAGELDQVRRQVILEGYDLCEAGGEDHWDAVQIHADFCGYSPESLFQLLAFQWGKDYEAKQQLNQMMSQGAVCHSTGEVLCIIVPSDLAACRVLELYGLKKSLCWQGITVRWAVFAAVDFSAGPRLLKFMEQAMRFLPEELEGKENCREEESLVKILTKIIRENL